MARTQLLFKELKVLVKAIIFAESNNTEGAEKQPNEEGFEKVRRRKRHNTDETAVTVKKAAVQAKTAPTVNSFPPKEVTTRNFFAPSERQKWILIPATPRARHVRRQPLEKQVDRHQ
jgi:hypothetical protein